MVGRGGGGGSSGGGGWLDSIRTKFGGGSGGFVLHKRRRFAIKRGLDLDLDLTNGRREEKIEDFFTFLFVFAKWNGRRTWKV